MKRSLNLTVPERICVSVVLCLGLIAAMFSVIMITGETGWVSLIFPVCLVGMACGWWIAAGTEA